MGAFDDLPATKADPFADLPAKGEAKLPEHLSTGLIEAGTNLATGVAGAAAGGITGLATGDPGAVEPVAEALTYQPRTEKGKAISAAVQYPFEKWEQFSDWAGEKARELGATPEQATGLKTTLMVPAVLRRVKAAGAAKPAPSPTAEPTAQPAPPAPAEHPFPIAPEEKPAVRPEGKITRTKPKPGDEVVGDPFADLPEAGDLSKALPLAEEVRGVPTKEALIAEAREKSGGALPGEERMAESERVLAEPLTDEEALEKFGPGVLGANQMLNPELVGQALKDVASSARDVLVGALGAPGEKRNLFSPIRNREQTNVARIDRWATGEGYGIRQAFPKPAEREALTLALVRGDLSKLSGEQLAIAQKLQQSYRQMGQYALEANMLDGLRQNYSPQIWDMTDKRTKNMIEMWREARERGPISEDSPLIRERGGSGGTFSPFTLQRAIANVEEGMKLGLKPASLDAAALFETYAKSMGRAVERGKSITALSNLTSEDGVPLVLSKLEAPRDWVLVRHPDLEGLRVHPDIAPAVKVLMESDSSGVIAGMAQLAAYSSKRALVSYSLFHPTALVEAWMGSGGNPLTVKTAIDTALRKYREGGVADLLDEGLAGGLKIGAPLEDVMSREKFGSFLNRAEKVLDKVGGGALVRLPRAIDQALQRATWDYVHTGLKIDTFLRKYEYELAKNAEAIAEGKVTRAAISRQVAEFTNSTFGGLNWERMIDKFDTPGGRKIMSEVLSHSGRRWMQTFMFAPDWLVSTVSSWTNAASVAEANAIRAQLARRYLLTSALWTYTIGNALNYSFTGHSMFENRSQKKDASFLDNAKAKTEVQLGDGRRMNINKHFMEVPHLLADPVQFGLNKVNPLTVGEPIEQIVNRQWLSTGWTPPITTKKDTGAKAAGKRVLHAGEKLTPITGISVMDQGPAGLGGFFGFPVYGRSEEQKYREREERAK